MQSDSEYLEKIDRHVNDADVGDSVWLMSVEFYLYPTVGTVLIHSVKPELTE